MHFSKCDQALIADSETERKDKPYANLTTSDDSSCDKQARIIAVMVSPAADTAYFATKKASLNIGKISYMAS